jgi:diguanylate cyclase (GGDEF)-like protein
MSPEPQANRKANHSLLLIAHRSPLIVGPGGFAGNLPAGPLPRPPAVLLSPPLAVVSSSVSRRAADDERTVVTTLKAAVAPRPDDASDSACLVVIYGPDLGRRLQLHRDAAVEIGRQPTCDFPIEQESVSRRHARFVWTQGHWHVVDLGSTNGTYVNDDLATDRVLRDGDQVKIGRAIIKFLESGSVETSYHEEIYRLMTYDGLTGVHNKRFFHDTLEREVSRSRRYRRLLSLILFDIDLFKSVNDTYGHIAGDAVLRQLAAYVRGHLRREDVFARVGGEEFAVLLPEIGAAECSQVAEKIRSLIERSHFSFDNVTIPVTVSLGVATVAPEVEESADALYARADGRLYQAKQAGRNRVCG